MRRVSKTRHNSLSHCFSYRVIQSRGGGIERWQQPVSNTQCLTIAVLVTESGEVRCRLVDARHKRGSKSVPGTKSREQYVRQNAHAGWIRESLPPALSYHFINNMGYGYYEIRRPDQAFNDKPMKRGYMVAGVCHEKGCKEKIDRGMAYLCYNCTWYFCGKHQDVAYCTKHDEPIESECFAGESSQVCRKCAKILEKWGCEDFKISDSLLKPNYKKGGNDMTYCKKCNGMVGDVGDPHHCLAQPERLYNPPMTGLPPGVIEHFGVDKITPLPVKCAQCGSTTIDHTENQCNINRHMGETFVKDNGGK